MRHPGKPSATRILGLKEEMFNPSGETSSPEPPAKCLYRGAGEEGGGWKRLTLPEQGMRANLFGALGPAERKKPLLWHEVVQFIIASTLPGNMVRGT